ncbi:uncharacterized protein EDB91DRAFT_1086050 [Suillus paluster]|uniref:uncharacterized protein n=1 Tax=Suillus paluster TaxID=48578 RepID=UPI001B87A9F3|nr:uncharacterized protein EDB91DRAFT_1086050 [Suillus paluster]KAG1728482.1 hypothetical protein EDB91DRAFT_1086050 [Suillus paluster]
MFTSRSIIFALLSFLAGANADSCAVCPGPGHAIYERGLGAASPRPKLRQRDILHAGSYDGWENDGTRLVCQYNSDSGEYSRYTNIRWEKRPTERWQDFDGRLKLPV